MYMYICSYVVSYQKEDVKMKIYLSSTGSFTLSRSSATLTCCLQVVCIAHNSGTMCDMPVMQRLYVCIAHSLMYRS